MLLNLTSGEIQEYPALIVNHQCFQGGGVVPRRTSESDRSFSWLPRGGKTAADRAGTGERVNRNRQFIGSSESFGPGIFFSAQSEQCDVRFDYGNQ